MIVPILLLVFGIVPNLFAADTTFQTARNLRDPHLLTVWGQRYETGVSVPRDLRKALRLYCKAARMGHGEAQYRLGRLYLFGSGVRKDRERAAAWFFQAKQRQYKQAEIFLKLLRVRKPPKRAARCPEERTSEKTAERSAVPSRQARAFRPQPAPGKIAELVRALAPQYRLDPNLVLAVVKTESNFNPMARSPKNAKGLMQLIPATAKRFGVQDIWDPEQNLRGGMAYLRWLLDQFDGDIALALAAYNAGEGAVQRHGGVPPYRETQTYVQRILNRLGLATPSEAG